MKAIEVEGLGKRYKVGLHKQPYRTLRESISRTVTAPFRRLAEGLRGADSMPEGAANTFWALQDISFDLEEGKVLGVIGHNGAGKSTLLKILARITPPSTGRAVLRGRIGSLLEVGTGFHPELSGRENIYLNGAILGMRRAEIDAKLDDIAAFAEVERFLDTAVKFYSSGMYLRLAFGVAAHLEPEILLVDEVLAVGDAAFQKKCLGKMGEVAAQGRTVLFVSHNMGAVNTLCDRAILLADGRIAADGEAGEVTASYLTQQLSEEGEDSGPGYTIQAKNLEPRNKGHFQVLGLELENPAAPEIGPRTGDPLILRVRYRSTQNFVSPTFWFRLRTIFGQEIFRLSTRPISGFEIESLHEEGTAELRIEALPVTSSRYLLDFGMAREMMGWEMLVEGIAEVQVSPQDVYGSGCLLDHTRGLIYLSHEWSHRSGLGASS